MEKLSNYIQILQWNFRTLVKSPQKTVAPVIWRQPTITSSHEPSDDFRSKLTQKENEKVNKILEEMQLFSRLSVRFPKKFRDKDWKNLLEMKTRKARFEQTLFLYSKERLAAKIDGKKENGRKKETREKVDNPIWTIQSSEKYFQLRHVIEGYRLENRPILAVDCQFLTNLSPRGRELTALQLQYLASENRDNLNPFRLYFVNYDNKDPKVKALEKSKLMMCENPDRICPIVHKGGLKEVFEFESPEEVIYLSPDAPEILETVEDDKIYVIGGIVDRVPEHGISKNASLEAARSAGVPARKLPINQYIDFKSGSKFLTLLAVAEILRQVNLHGDWKKAMEIGIPKRNTRGSEEKNPVAKAANMRIRAFNTEVLRRVDQRLGKDILK